MKKTIILAIVLLVSLVFGYPVIPVIGSSSNLGLAQQDGTFLIGLNPVFSLGFSQNLLTMDALNAFLNEEEIVISKENLSNALNGIKVALPVTLGAYGQIKLFGLSLVPYSVIDGTLALSLPRSVSELLLEDIVINESYSSQEKGFVRSNINITAGAGIVLDGFYVAGYTYLPLTYVDNDYTYMDVEYTSSASPAQANLNAEFSVKLLSSVNYQAIINQNIDSILSDLQENYGLALEAGFAGKNFGFAVRNVSMKPAVVKYFATVNGYFNANYSGEGTTIDFETDQNIGAPIYGILLESTQVTIPIEITAYYKADGFFNFGLFGSYWLDGNWKANAYAGLDIGILRAYYLLGIDPYSYSHSIGLMTNLSLLKADLRLTSTVDQLVPIGTTTPGFGLSLRFSAGL